MANAPPPPPPDAAQPYRVPPPAWFAEQGIDPPTPVAKPAAPPAALAPPEPLWDCNVVVMQVYAAMQTQWRVGMGGATGLDYAGLERVFWALEIAPDAQRDVFWGLQVVERMVLQVWRSQAQRTVIDEDEVLDL